MAKKNVWDDAQEEGGSVFKFDEVGTVLEGILLERKVQPSKYRPGETGGVYKILAKDGTYVVFATDSLDDSIVRAVGKAVRIELTELKPKPGKNDQKVFDVVSKLDSAEMRRALGIRDAFAGAKTESGADDEEEI